MLTPPETALLLVQTGSQRMALQAADVRGVVAHTPNGPLDLLSWHGQVLPIWNLGGPVRVAAVLAQGGRGLGVGVERVLRTVRAEIITAKLEGQHDVVEGAFHYEGQLVPVLGTQPLLRKTSVELEYRSPEPPEPAAPALVVILSQNRWRLPVAQVERVCAALPVMPLPGRGAVSGLIQWEGRVMPVVEPARLMGGEPGEFMVILRRGLALRVQRLAGVQRASGAPTLEVDALLERLECYETARGRAP